ncbi:MAG: hypothetical protein ABIH11_05905 [Candidatus Altiarchaeota archaeon]
MKRKMDAVSRQYILKTGVMLLLLANFSLTVNAGPIGDAALGTSRFYWILMMVALLFLAVIIVAERRSKPIEILGLSYDRKTHKLELTIRNNSTRGYCIKTALRHVKPAANPDGAASSEGRVSMASASASRPRKMFDLLCEDDKPVFVKPRETKTLNYGLILPQDHVNFENNKNVEVHISYGEDMMHLSDRLDEDDRIDLIRDAPADALFTNDEISEASDMMRELLPDADPAFTQSEVDDAVRMAGGMLQPQERVFTISEVEEARRMARELCKKPEETPAPEDNPPVSQPAPEDDAAMAKQIVDTVILVKDLSEAVENTPDELVSQHMEVGEISEWVRNIIQDHQLADRIDSISGDPHHVKKSLLGILDEHLESKKHPYLRRVRHDESFRLMLDHGQMMGEVFLLEDLLASIHDSTDRTIEFHTRNGNDFANWIRHCVGDTLLADALEECRGDAKRQRRQMIETLNARIMQLRY